MAKFTIYSKDGATVRHTGEPQYSGSYMGVDYVEFRSVSSPTPIDWQIGDYVDYYRTGKRYRLYSLPMPKKVARKGDNGASFEYSNVQLHGATKELEIAPFRDLVPKDNKIHFSTRPDVSTYEDVYGVARRIQECMDDIFPDRWRIEVYNTDDADMLALFGETKEYSVSNGSCLDALSQIYDTWKNVGWIHTYDSASEVDVITIGRANVRDTENTSDAFVYGIGKGLTSIKKASANEGELATRLYVYGSERNIQTRYYNGQNILNKDSVDIRNLMLPIEKWGKTDGLPDARKAYLQADDSIIEKYGLIPRTVYFDGNENEEIYPSITGLTMAQVRQAMIDAGQGDSEYLPTAHIHRIDVIEESYSSSFDEGTKEQTEQNMTFHLGLYQMGFNIAEQGEKTSEGHATISMKSGACAGREFKVRKYADRTYTKADGSKCLVYEIERNWDDSIGMGFPNKTYPINDGDEFVLLDIPMPDFYIALAEDKLLKAGEKMLADYTRVSAFYEPSINAIKIKDANKLLCAGMFMQVHDEDIIDTPNNKDYVLIDTLTIDEKSDLPIYKVTLREQKRSSRTYSALEDMIEDAKEVSREDIRRERQYTDRRFRSAQESLEMLQSAFSNFSEGINPVTVSTIALLVGDESLQFKFTESRDSLVDLPACPLYYDESTKQLKGQEASLVHMTFGVNSVMPREARKATDYKSWDIPAKDSAVLDDPEKSYYVYVKANKEDATAEYVLEPKSKEIEEEDGYYFLVGLLNKEYNGTRDFVTVYGFTEILPGQITTDVIRSADGKTIFDLLQGIISLGEQVGMSGKDDYLRIWAGATKANRDTAPFRVYNDGLVRLERAYVKGDVYAESGKIGPLNIMEQGLSMLDYPENATTGDIFPAIAMFIKTMSFSLMRKTSSSQSVSISNVTIPLEDTLGPSFKVKRDNNYMNPNYAAIEGDCNGGDESKAMAFRAIKGMFAGLRPKARIADTTPFELDEFDHTIFAPYSEVTITLPASPQVGQEYVILAPNGGVTVDGNGKEMFLFATGQEHTSFACGDIALRLEARLYYTGTEWYVTTIKH